MWAASTTAPSNKSGKTSNGLFAMEAHRRRLLPLCSGYHQQGLRQRTCHNGVQAHTHLRAGPSKEGWARGARPCGITPVWAALPELTQPACCRPCMLALLAGAHLEVLVDKEGLGDRCRVRQPAGQLGWWHTASQLLAKSAVPGTACLHHPGKAPAPLLPGRLDEDGVKSVLALEQLVQDADEVAAHCGGGVHETFDQRCQGGGICGCAQAPPWGTRPAQHLSAASCTSSTAHTCELYASAPPTGAADAAVVHLEDLLVGLHHQAIVHAHLKCCVAGVAKGAAW